VEIPRRNFCFGVLLCFCWYIPYCTDPYRSKLGHGNRGSLLHVFQGSFFSEFSEGGRPYRKRIQQPILGTFYEVLFSANPYSCTDWHGNQGRFCAVSGFSLGWKSVIAAVMYFPEDE
jgi:hypothetical protein